MFETPIGRIGLLICWDIWFPEVPRLMTAQGADIICSLNNWVWTPPPLFDEAGRCMASYLTMTAAHVNNVYIAAAKRIGSERGGRFLGLFADCRYQWLANWRGGQCRGGGHSLRRCRPQQRTLGTDLEQPQRPAARPAYRSL